MYKRTIIYVLREQTTTVVNYQRNTDVPCIVDFKIRFKAGIKCNTVKYSTVIKYRSNILLKDTDKQFIFLS